MLLRYGVPESARISVVYGLPWDTKQTDLKFKMAQDSAAASRRTCSLNKLSFVHRAKSFSWLSFSVHRAKWSYISKYHNVLKVNFRYRHNKTIRYETAPVAVNCRDWNTITISFVMIIINFNKKVIYFTELNTLYKVYICSHRNNHHMYMYMYSRWLSNIVRPWGVMKITCGRGRNSVWHDCPVLGITRQPSVVSGTLSQSVLWFLLI